MNERNLVMSTAESPAHATTSLDRQLVLKSQEIVTKVPGTPLIGEILVMLGVFADVTFQQVNNLKFIVLK